MCSRATACMSASRHSTFHIHCLRCMLVAPLHRHHAWSTRKALVSAATEEADEQASLRKQGLRETWLIWSACSRLWHTDRESSAVARLSVSAASEASSSRMRSGLRTEEHVREGQASAFSTGG